MSKESKYFLKWDVENKSFLLDPDYAKNGLAYSIARTQITPAQAAQFAERVEERYFNRNKYVDMNVLEFEFKRFFKVCKCGAATSRVDWVIRQKDLCFSCYQAQIPIRRAAATRAYAERMRIKRLQQYAKTDQGIADAVGVPAIKANIKIQLAKHGKTQAELGKHLGLYDGTISKILNGNKSIRIEYIYKIAEWLFVPIDLLLKMPRGSRPLRKKYKIPINIYRGKMRYVRIEKYQLD